MTDLLTFDRFEQGQHLGTIADRVDPTLAQRWASLYGEHPGDDDRIPPTMVAALIMRAYLRAVTPRPPGNVHTGMEMTVHDLPQGDEALTSEVSCAAKELRGERRFVHFTTRTTGTGGRALFDGRLTLIWSQ